MLMSTAADGHRYDGPEVRSGCTLERRLCCFREQICPVTISGDGLRVCSERDMGWHEEASHLYYSAGWLFESEQAAMLSLHKS